MSDPGSVGSGRAALEGVLLFVAIGLAVTAIGVRVPDPLFGLATILAVPLLALAPPLLAVWRRGCRAGLRTRLLVGAAVGLFGALAVGLANLLVVYALGQLPAEQAPAPGLVSGLLATLFLLGSPVAALANALVAIAGGALCARLRH